MKTNVIVERSIENLSVFQRSCDKMFNATDLLKKWNAASNVERKMDNYFMSDKTKEYIDTIMKKEDLHTPKMVYVKSKASRGSKAGTWMHPMLFFDFAMWINPSFKYEVIKFVSDQMINYRCDAGDEYIALGKSVQKIVPNSFMSTAMRNIADAINWVAFNRSSKNERNLHGDETSQLKLAELERHIASLINEGFIRSYDQLINYLRKKWQEKYQPKVLRS